VTHQKPGFRITATGEDHVDILDDPKADVLVRVLRDDGSYREVWVTVAAIIERAAQVIRDEISSAVDKVIAEDSAPPPSPPPV